MLTIKIAHNILRWAILLFGIWTVLNAITGVVSKRKYTAGDNRSSLLFMIFCDIQLVLGLILYFSGDWFSMLKENMSQVMKDPYNRFFSVEHASMMIIAWLLVHIGRSSVKRLENDAAKHRRSLLFFGIAILLILVAVPWPFRPIIGQPWFRWFN